MYLYSKKYNFFCLICLSLWLVWSCRNSTSAEKKPEERILTDQLERKVVLPAQPARVMALAPSLTEMLFFVCDSMPVVAVTQNDNYPPLVKNKPIVSNYPMDFEGLLKVRPDLVFAMEGITPLADAERITQMGIPVYYHSYQTVDDILEGMLEIGRVMNCADQAQKRVDSLKSLRDRILRQTADRPKPRVLAITWPDPIYVFGQNTVFTDKLRIAGATNAVDAVFDVLYPALSREYILKLNPDIIIGGSFEHMDSTFFALYPELKRTRAYQQRRVYAVTDDLNSRPGPRVLESILELARIIHPETARAEMPPLN